MYMYLFICINLVQNTASVQKYYQGRECEFMQLIIHIIIFT